MNIFRKIILLSLFGAQLVLYFLQNKYAFFSNISFGIISASILSLSLLVNDLEVFCPVYLHLSKVKSFLFLKIKLKILYALIGFLSCLLGVGLYRFYKLFFSGIVESFNLLTVFPNGFCYNFEQPISLYFEFLHRTFFTSSNILFLFWYVPVALSFMILTTVTKKFGSRAFVYRIYNKHKLKFLLNKQESRLAMICFFVGISLNYYSSLLFLAISAFRGFAKPVFDDWLLKKAMTMTKDTAYRYLDTFIYEVYKSIIILSILWVPFLDIKINLQNYFALLMCCPVIFCIFIGFINLRATKKLIILKIIYSFSICGAGFLQYYYYWSNPIIYWLIKVSPIASPNHSKFKIVFISLLTASFLSFHIYSALSSWIDKKEMYRIEKDPIGCYFNEKFNVFIFSLIFRILFIIIYYKIPALHEDEILNSFFESIIIFFIMVTPLMIRGDNPEAFYKNLKLSFSKNNFEKSINKWDKRINFFMTIRSYFEVIFIISCLIYILITVHHIFKILFFIMGLFIVGLYYFYTIVEISNTNKYIKLKIRIKYFKKY